MSLHPSRSRARLRGAPPELTQAEHGPGCTPLNLSGGLGELRGLAHTSAGRPSPPRMPRDLWILTTLLVDKPLPSKLSYLIHTLIMAHLLASCFS